MNMNSTRKIGQLKLNVIRFGSADVIATSDDPLMIASQYEIIANPNSVANFYQYSTNTLKGEYYDPNSGQ